MSDSASPGSDQDAHDSIGVEVSGEAKGIKFRVSAKGLYGWFVGLGLGLTAELVFLHPQQNPQHFVLTLLTVAAGSFLGGMCTMAARAAELRSINTEFRQEVTRMAREKRVLEAQIVPHRISSDEASSEVRKLPSGGGGE